MTQAGFVMLLEQELKLRFCRFDRADLVAFVADSWPLILDDPDATRWADAFLDTGKAQMLA